MRQNLRSLSVIGSLTVALASPCYAAKDDFQVLAAFPGAPGGSAPSGTLCAVQGAVYGTTVGGGTTGYGTVFAVTPDGTLSTVYNFTQDEAGGAPQQGLVCGNGVFYGELKSSIFSLKGTTLKMLYNFTDGPIFAGLTRIGNTLYGISFTGGANKLGYLFSVTTGGIETDVHDFGGTGDGASPDSLFVLKATLYGTTYAGGSGGGGTVYAYTPGGQYTVLHSFPNTKHGSHEPGPLTAKGGELYGVTGMGGAESVGTFYKITPGGAYTELAAVNANGNGAYEILSLQAIGSKIFGLAFSGTESLFTVSPTGETTVVHQFPSLPQIHETPDSNLVELGGVVYGTTSRGPYPDKNGQPADGTVYTFVP